MLGWAAGLLLILQWNRSTIDWYFRGHEPGRAWFFIASGIATSAGLFWLAVNWTSKDVANVVDAPPLGSSMTDIMAWQQLFWQQKKFERQWKRMTNSINRKLELAIQGATISGWRARSNLWIVGNLGIFGPSGDTNISKWMLFVPAVVLIVSAVVNYCDPSDLSPLTSLRNPMAAILLLTNCPSSYLIFAATFWRCRRKLFACESLRPMSRPSIQSRNCHSDCLGLAPSGGASISSCWRGTRSKPILRCGPFSGP